MTLSSESTKALIDKFARDDEQREHPEAALDQRAFLVSLDGVPVYGGIFLHPMSSMGISFPVIYVEAQDGKLAFAIRPVHSVLGDYSEYEPAWFGIRDDRIRDLFTATE